jgi:hypothetical protein
MGEERTSTDSDKAGAVDVQGSDRFLLKKSGSKSLDGVVTRGKISSVVEGIATVTYIELGGEGHHRLAHLPVQCTCPPVQSRVPGLAHPCCLAPLSSHSNGWSRMATTALAMATQGTISLLTMQDRASNMVD